jgi:MFS family permease
VSRLAPGWLPLLRANPQVRRLWLAQVVSELGDWLNLVALFRILARIAPGATAPGLLMVIQMLPALLVAPLAGPLADRLDRRKIMIAADLLRALVVLGFLFIDRPERLWLLYLLAGTQFSLAAFFEPARSALVPRLATGEALVAANALMGVTWSVMLAVGGALGGLLAGLVSTGAAFAVDSLSFLVSAGILVGLRFSGSPPAAGEPGGRREAPPAAPFGEVVTEVIRRPRLLTAIGTKAALAISGGGLWILTVVYGQKVFPLGADGAVSVGLFYGAHGVGAIAGAFLAPMVFRREEVVALRFLLGAFLLRSVFWTMLGFAGNLGWALVAIVLISAVGSFTWVASVTLLQRHSAPAIHGRLFALDLAVVTTTLAVTIQSTGFALDRLALSVRQATFATAAAALLVSLPFVLPILRWERWRENDPFERERSPDE